MATEYQRELARKKARAAGKTPASDKKLINLANENKLGKNANVSNKGRTINQRKLDDIKLYRKKYQEGKPKDTRTLSSLISYGKAPTPVKINKKPKLSNIEQGIKDLQDQPPGYIKPKYRKNK